MAEIILEGINKYFRQMHAVQDLDLMIRDRSFHTLLGPSGCGKTTTLCMIAGLERPTPGLSEWEIGSFIPAIRFERHR